MDYEQYLYGRAGRDAAPRRARKPRQGRIGSLVAGAVVALGVVAGVALIAGKVNGEGRAGTAGADDAPPVVTLAASEAPVPPHRR